MEQSRVKRCSWVEGKPDYYLAYHDYIWGKPVHDDQELFKWLALEIFHIGLSWQIVLAKYDAFIAAFDEFDYHKVAAYDDRKIEELMMNKEIIRYRKKIEAVIQNARLLAPLRKEYGSFDTFLWSFTNGQSIINEHNEQRTRSELSDQLTKALKSRGFQFIGSVTMYSYLQAIGIINNHEKDCDFR